MAFEGEYAGYKPLGRIAGNQRVQETVRLCRKRVPSVEDDEGPQLTRFVASGVPFIPNLVVAVDGSYHQHAVDNGFPGAELAYVTIASVLVDLKRQRELDEKRPVSPLALLSTEQADTIDAVLPGCNVIIGSDLSPSHSFRRAFFEECVRTTFLTESLIDTYEALLARKPTSKSQQCPFEDCPDGDAYPSKGTYRPRKGVSECTCEFRRPVYSTDALRMHEGLNPTGPSGATFAEAMQVWERLCIVNAIRAIVQKDLAWLLRGLAFVIDGPLALFGHPAWLSQAIADELMHLNEISVKESGRELLIVGVEKSGMFVDYFERLDRASDPASRATVIPPGTALLPSSPYIRKHIVVGEGKDYGVDTYFGRKFFYKTKSGARLVASLPFLYHSDRDVSRAEPDQFPRLSDAINLLDELASFRYPNAISPLISAHAEAAIPLNIGKKVLERLTQEYMKA